MKPTLWRILRAVLATGLVLATTCSNRCALGEEFAEPFESQETSWTLRPTEAQIVSHARVESDAAEGSHAERVVLQAGRPGTFVQLDHALPPAVVIDELKLSVAFRSNRNGPKLSLRIVFPNQVDPRTSGKVVKISISGASYTGGGRWQTLECATLQKELNRQIVQLRDDLKMPDINIRDAYVDRAMIVASVDPGEVEIAIDDLHFGPLVKPQAPAESPVASSVRQPAVEFELDRLVVDKRPFFPRIVPHHGEDLQVLKEAGFNVVWIKDYREQAVLDELVRLNLRGMATPPRAVSATGVTLNAQDAGLMPFSEVTDPILFWYLGTRIPPDAKDELVSWVDQVRSADPLRRPLLADVTGSEQIFSKYVEMLSASRHAINTSLPIKEYRDWLVKRGQMANAGSFMWTWIPTEAAAQNVEWRESGDKQPIIVEPEQIRLLVYAALSAGSRGVGFYKTNPFDANRPGDRERLLAISQLNLELEILEPFLATGKLVSQPVPFQVTTRPEPVIGQRDLDFRTRRDESWAKLRARDDQQRRQSELPSELEAAVISTDFGAKLLLPVWYRKDAQYVPDQMAANDAKIIVPGGGESAAAWEVTTTGVTNLECKRVKGGLQIKLKKFNQTAAIVLTSDQSLIDGPGGLRQKINTLAERSARISIELARLKLERVRGVDSELSTLGVSQRDAPQLLGLAESTIANADRALQGGDYNGARELSEHSLQYVRILQRAHWNDAVRNLSSPSASPYTSCFQTLPDHWKMVAALGRSPVKLDTNLLPYGDFEDPNSILVGWEHSQNALPGVKASADLYESPHKGKYALRLVAWPENPQAVPTVISRSPVTVTTPPVMVRSGQVVHISGWIKVPERVHGSQDGVIVYDSQSGPVGALRFEEVKEWKQFSLVREIQQSGELTITISLTGLGEVLLDDLVIVPHDPKRDTIATGGEPEGRGPGLLDRLNPISRLRSPRLPRNHPRRDERSAENPTDKAAK